MTGTPVDANILPGSPAVQPRKILVIGDVGNDIHYLPWVASKTPGWLPEHPRVWLQLGDFSYRPGPHLTGLVNRLHKHKILLLVVPGNHEDWPWIASLQPAGDGWLEDPALPEPLRPHLRVLPRGYRWQWHDRTWMAVGGAYSIDRAVRAGPGIDWWPEEEITEDDVTDAVSGGRCDVLACHDAPAGVHYAMPPLRPGWTLTDLAGAEAHRDKLQRIINPTRPSHVMHGHLHLGSQRVTDFGYGPVEVTCLDEGWWQYARRILDVQSMTWSDPGARLTAQNCQNSMRL